MGEEEDSVLGSGASPLARMLEGGQCDFPVVRKDLIYFQESPKRLNILGCISGLLSLFKPSEYVSH